MENPKMAHAGKRALVIAHEPDGPARQIETRLVERGFTVDTHVVTHGYQAPNDATPWPDFDGYDLILPMGSIRSLTRKEEIDSWVHEELRLLHQAHQAGIPMLGVCFGGQLLAEVGSRGMASNEHRHVRGHLNLGRQHIGMAKPVVATGVDFALEHRWKRGHRSQVVDGEHAMRLDGVGEVDALIPALAGSPAAVEDQ